MTKRAISIEYPTEWYSHRGTSLEDALSIVSKEAMLEDLRMMLKIRQFEIRGKAAYLEGKIGGFFHSYAGSESSAVAAVRVFGRDNPYTATYRCHGIALALGVSADGAMAELFGKKTGIVGGRGGSMHFHFREGKSMLTGGFGIVGGHLALAAGASFARVYEKDPSPLSICFLGDGAVVQGVFHETLNIAALWGLPVIYIIENNTFGMGTHVERALSFRPLANMGKLYGGLCRVVDGRSYFDLVKTFDEVKQWVLKERKPAVIEVMIDRYEGHSMSDSMPYRTREETDALRSRDPIQFLAKAISSTTEMEAMEAALRTEILEAVDRADKAPLPDLATLGEGIFA